MSSHHEEVAAVLADLQSHELSILRLSEPIAALNTPDASNRTSDVSTDAFENPSPASLAADLSHYKVNLPDRVFSIPAALIVATGTLL